MSTNLHVRKIPFKISQAMKVDADDFSYRWVQDEGTAVLGLGYSLYFEYIEYFIAVVNRYIRKHLTDKKIADLEKTFTYQEMLHASAHKPLNNYLLKTQPLAINGHPRVYDFFLNSFLTQYSPLIQGLKKNKDSIEIAPFMHDVVKKISVFESITCVSSFVFFSQLFDNGSIRRTVNLSENIGILYLFGYHFAEEIEHCSVSHDIYELLFSSQVWDDQTIEKEIRGTSFAEMDCLCASLSAANNLGIEVTLDEIQNSHFSLNTKRLQKEMITPGFHPNEVSVKEQREYFVSKWDNEWEPYLRSKILS